MKPEWSLQKRLGLLSMGTGAAKARILDAFMGMPGLLVIVTNALFELQTANEYFYTYFDCVSADVTGKALFDFLGDDIHQDMNKAHIERVLAEGHVWDYDARTTRPDGETVLIRWNHTVLEGERNRPLILSIGTVQPLYNFNEAYVPNAAPESLPAAVINPQAGYFSDAGHDTLNEMRLPPRVADRSGLFAAESACPVMTEGDIRQAMAEGLFVLYYQPYVHARSKKIVGAEVLVRLKHPRWGVLPPGAFLPVAEETGLIIPLGEFIFDAACKKIKRWTEAGQPLFVSVNISARQFRHESFAETLLNAITRHEAAAGRLMLEITEDTVAYDLNAVQAIFRVLRGMGCHICLDDYGTGFAPLRYLEKLDIDSMKIDRTFLTNAQYNRRSYAIIESVIVLAHGLGISVTAEGVETQPQLDFLIDKACDYVQGYLLSHPLPENAFDRLLFENPGFYLRNM